jgi:hypothetical protein
VIEAVDQSFVIRVLKSWSQKEAGFAEGSSRLVSSIHRGSTCFPFPIQTLERLAIESAALFFEHCLGKYFPA